LKRGDHTKLIIINQNALDRGKSILRHYLFGDGIIQNGASKISQEVQLQQLSPEKPNLSLGTQISSH
jgi:hypothetical protein